MIDADRLVRLTEEFVARHRLPGASVAVTRGADVVWSAGDGRMLFQIASISKTFTATRVLQLHDEGRLDLDDPVERHVPEFAAVENPFGPTREVTLRRLLLHASGLQGESHAEDPRQRPLLTQPDVIRSLTRTRVVLPPASAFRYSNLGYRLLAETVIRVGGAPFADQIRDAILVPLGMDATTVRPSGARRAQGHDTAGAPIPAVDAALCVGDGDLWSSVEDLARWIAQQLRTEDPRGRGQILDGATLALMHRPVLHAGWNEARGLGWGVHRVDELVLVGHGGELDGFASDVSFSPEHGVGAIVLLNGEPAGTASELTRALIAAALPTDAPPAPVVAVDDRRHDLEGTYADRFEELRVEHRDGRLVFVVDDDDPVTLRPTAEPDCFVYEDVGGRGGELLRFVRDGSGAVEALNAGGYPFERRA